MYNHYNALGLRTSIEENGISYGFTYDRGSIVTEVDSNNQLISRSIRGYNLIAQKDNRNVLNYYLHNGHGDVTNLVDGNGQVLNSYQYDAFGNTLSHTEKVTNRFMYAGEQFDSITGHYYLRARYYAPNIGRFTQEDRYRGDGLNLYAYVSNNPIKYIDPSGYAKCSGDNQNSGENTFWQNVGDSFTGYFEDAWNGIVDTVTHPVDSYVNMWKNIYKYSVPYQIYQGWKHTYYEFPKSVYTDIITGDSDSRAEFLGEYLAETTVKLAALAVAEGANQIYSKLKTAPFKKTVEPDFYVGPQGNTSTSLYEYDLYLNAEAARDNLIINTTGAKKKATVIGAYDIETGNVVADFAGPIPENINPQLIKASNQIGGVGSTGVNGINTVGACAEFQTANQLLNLGGSINNIRFTEAIRPRNGKIIPSCSNCVDMFK